MKKLNILVITALVLGLGVAAQAQNTFVTTEMVIDSNDAARMGGESEESGSIWLTFSTAEAIARTTVTLDYSVPLAGDITVTNDTTYTSVSTDVAGTAKNDAPRGGNDGNGTVVVSSIPAGTTTLVIRSVMLDVSGASGPVTVTAKTVSSDNTDFLRFDGPNTGTVIDAIIVGVEVEAEAGTVRTRGTGSGGETATLTLEEAYDGAFMRGNELEIDFSGIPDEATLTAEVTGIKMAADAVDGTPAVTTTDMDPFAKIGAVSSSGTATLTLGGDATDDDSSTMRAAPAEVVLMLTLTAATSNDEISFPLDVGEVTAEVTFAGDAFDDIFTDQVAVFNIRPAQCEMLFPLVTYIPGADGFNTGFAIVNPAYSKGAASGHIEFTFYKKDTPETKYVTSGGSPGTGLEPDGRLAPGSTYVVNADQLLEAANWAELPAGHVHVLTDYTNCNGLGLIYGALGIDQSYNAIVINADTGMK